MAAEPSLTEATALAVVACSFLAPFVGAIAGAIAGEYKVRPRGQVLVAFLTAILVCVAVAGVTALVHHSAWVDYERWSNQAP